MQVYWKRQSIRQQEEDPGEGLFWGSPRSGMLGLRRVPALGPQPDWLGAGCLKWMQSTMCFSPVLSMLLILWNGQDPPLWTLLYRSHPFLGCFLFFFFFLWRLCLPTLLHCLNTGYHFHSLLLNLWLCLNFCCCLMQVLIVKFKKPYVVITK